MIHIGLRLAPPFARRRRGPVTPPDAVDYPDVPAVDLMAAGGSLRFPEGNWGPNTARAGMTGQKGLLAQSKAGLIFAGSTTPSATFAIVRLPVDKRDGPYSKGIFGVSGNSTGRYRLFLNNPANSVAANRNRFQFVLGGGSGSDIVDMLSAPWTEDAALVVAMGDGAGNWQLDWYSLIDGTRYPGVAQLKANVIANSATGTFNIGGTGAFTSFTANSRPSVSSIGEGYLWDGEIAAVGHLNGVAIAPEDWARIARGAALREVLPAANLRWLREFDGTAASLAPPAWATGDATAPATVVGGATAEIPGSTLLPGSDLRARSEAAHVTLDQHSPGMVWGLRPGESRRDVPFCGRASGPVEIRIHEAGTGRVVRDWAPAGAPAAGRWSGSVSLPESTGGWLFAEVRLAAAPEIVARGRSEFGVGYKFLMMGQSQTSVALTTDATRLTVTAPLSGAVARQVVVSANKQTAGAAARRPVFGRIGTGVQAGGDGVVAFHNQFRRLKPKTPYLLIDEAVNGTSMSNLLDGAYDSVTNRHWSDLTDKLDRWGNDVTAVLFNWLMNEGATASYAGVVALMEDGFLPDHLGHRTHSLAAVLAPGWTLGVIGGDRETRDRPDQVVARTARIDFARAHGFTIGPMVSDYRIEDAGGAHPPTQTTNPAASLYGPPETFDNGAARFMQRMAVLALQTIGAVGRDVHPHYANARLSPDGTRILVDVMATGGGAIWSPAPEALRSWAVLEPGDAAAATTRAKGATAVLNTAVSPPRVEIARASGSWAAGTRVLRLDDSEKRDAGDGAAEDAIHAGGLYETWGSDTLGFGFPVIGSRDAAGRWTNVFDAVAAPA